MSSEIRGGMRQKVRAIILLLEGKSHLSFESVGIQQVSRDYRLL